MEKSKISWILNRVYRSKEQSNKCPKKTKANKNGSISWAIWENALMSHSPLLIQNKKIWPYFMDSNTCELDSIDLHLVKLNNIIRLQKLLLFVTPSLNLK